MRLEPASLLSVMVALSAATTDPARLDVLRSDIRFAGERGSISLTADFLAAPGDDPSTLRVTVGPTVVLDASLLSDRAKSRLNEWGDLKVRDPAHLREGCRLRLEYRPTSGYLRMKFTGFDPASIRADGASAVPVAVEVSGRTVRATVPFVVLSARRWTWRAEGRGRIGPEPPPVDPPVLPPPPPGDGYWQGVEFARGGNSAISTPTRTVVRSTAAFASLWNQHAPGTAPPAVDFGSSMVLVYIGGPGLPSNRVNINTLEVVSGTLFVTTAQGRNAFGDANISPYTMVAAPTTNMPVVWR